MMTLLPIPLIVAYSIWDYFLGHSMSFVINAQENRSLVPSLVAKDFFALFLGEALGVTVARRLSLFFRHIFPLIVGFERILGIVFLIYFGYVSQWYLPLMLYAFGMAGQFILVKAEIAVGLHRHLWTIIFVGVFVMPIILAYMFYVAAIW